MIDSSEFDLLLSKEDILVRSVKYRQSFLNRYRHELRADKYKQLYSEILILQSKLERIRLKLNSLTQLG